MGFSQAISILLYSSQWRWYNPKRSPTLYWTRVRDLGDSTLAISGCRLGCALVFKPVYVPLIRQPVVKSEYMYRLING